MGGHGGLNILPQKRWNVYNYENREKVRRDEEAAAKEEQLKREQARKRDAEFRLEQLRAAKGLAPLIQAKEPEQPQPSSAGHINLFEGIKIFDPIKGLENGGTVEKDESKRKKMKTEDRGSKVVTPEDEKYRLGYGVAGKGVKLPWYLQKPNDDVNGRSCSDDDDSLLKGDPDEKRRNGKKTIEELREERLKREKKEKERERVLIQKKCQRDRGDSRDRRFSRR